MVERLTPPLLLGDAEEETMTSFLFVVGVPGRLLLLLVVRGDRTSFSRPVLVVLVVVAILVVAVSGMDGCVMVVA
jgi:hypothetical protein